MTAYTTYIDNRKLGLMVTSPLDADEEIFQLDLTLKPSLFSAGGRRERVAELAQKATGNSHIQSGRVQIRNPRTARRFIGLLEDHRFLTNHDVVALQHTLAAWELMEG